MYYFLRIPPTLLFEFLRFVLRTPPFCFSFLPVLLGKTSFSHPLFLPMIFALLFPCLGSSVPHAPSIPSLIKLFSPGASLRFIFAPTTNYVIPHLSCLFFFDHSTLVHSFQTLSFPFYSFCYPSSFRSSSFFYFFNPCLLYTSPSPRDQRGSRMPSSA